MNIKKLSHEDFENLSNLVSSNKKFVNQFLKNYEINDNDSHIEYKTKWLIGMQRWYLGDSKFHDLYGVYDNDTLISCMSWRYDLPDKWSNGWIVGNLKSRPGYSFRTNGIVALWNKMFQICESKGLTQWHMLIVQDNKNKFQSVANRYFKEVDSRYNYHWSLTIPANTKPDEEWIWGTMGRTLLNTEVCLRTGVKK